MCAHVIMYMCEENPITSQLQACLSQCWYFTSLPSLISSMYVAMYYSMEHIQLDAECTKGG